MFWKWLVYNNKIIHIFFDKDSLKCKLIEIVKKETGIDFNNSNEIVDKSLLKDKNVFKKIMISLLDDNFIEYTESCKSIFSSKKEFLEKILIENQEFKNSSKK